MDLDFLQVMLVSTQVPWLPGTGLASWALHGAWAVVLGALTLGLVQLFRQHRHRWLAAMVALWAMWPGPESPAYWLGLAFQSPSLMSVLLCVVWAMRQRRASPFADLRPRGVAWPRAVLAGVGVLLGWVLLLDMLAWWPVSVYALGFGSVALLPVCALATLLWLGDTAGNSGRTAALCVFMVLLMFVLTRLPSGNLWDALLDPWLWVVLQVVGLMAGVRWLISPRRG